MAACLEPREATQATGVLIQAMTKTTDPEALGAAARALSATLTGDPRHPATRAAALVAVGAVLPGQPLPAPAMHLPAFEPPPCRLSTQDLVNLLKHPLCVDPARRVVLEQLARRYRRPFADHWEFVRFAQEQNLGLDFTTPPRRPQAPTREK